MFIAILEYDERRQARMRQIPAEHFPTHQPVLFDNAPDMNAWLSANLSDVALLCLDHDLGPTRLQDGVRFDPGIDRDVVDALVAHPRVCPVILHTSNDHAAPGMILALETHGWDVARVTPFDDLEWLTRVWAGVVEEKLR